LYQEPDHIINLIKGCVRNDRASQKLVYQEFYSFSMAICMRYSDSREEASEILNDAFMKIFRNISQFDLTKPFRPWLKKILMNTAINRFHQNQRRIQTEEIQNVDEMDSEKILSGISYEELVGMLQRLSPAYRTVFNLHVIEGYSHDEIAEMLSISAGTSKSNLFKAKEQLRKLLKEFFESDYVGAQ
jgi:RNA polymerase sigma factor (sigma-70 family)